MVYSTNENILQWKQKPRWMSQNWEQPDLTELMKTHNRKKAYSILLRKVFTNDKTQRQGCDDAGAWLGHGTHWYAQGPSLWWEGWAVAPISSHETVLGQNWPHNWYLLLVHWLVQVTDQTCSCTGWYTWESTLRSPHANFLGGLPEWTSASFQLCKQY